MNIEQHIDNRLANIRLLFQEASEMIEALKPGEKIPAVQLAKIIAERHGMNGATLYPTLKFLFDGYPGVEVKRGAQGGIMKLVSGEAATLSKPTTNQILSEVFNEKE